MIYPFDLRTVGVALGVALILGHALALVRSEWCRRALAAFPRSRLMGLVLLGVAAAWSFLLIRSMDLGEFASLRGVMLFAIAIGAVLTAIYVPDFLAVRALGMLVLLAAEPLLGAAFLRPELTRLLVVVLAYAWIFAGLFWVGMPFLMRDQLRWLLAKPARFTSAAWAGVAYGAVVLTCALTLW
jgi:hypothetical protein